MSPNPNLNSSGEQKKPGKPFFLKVLMAGLLIFALFNGLRVYGAFSSWTFLWTVGVRPGPGYIAASGVVFGLGFLAAFTGLLFQVRGAAWVVRAVVLVYVLWYWLDRLLLTRSPGELKNWPFAVGMTVLLVGFTLLALEAWKEILNG